MYTSDRKRGGDILKKALKILSVMLLLMILNFAILAHVVQAVESEKFIIIKNSYQNTL